MANLTRSLVRQNLSRYLRIVNRPTRYTHLIVYKTTFYGSDVFRASLILLWGDRIY